MIVTICVYNKVAILFDSNVLNNAMHISSLLCVYNRMLLPSFLFLQTKLNLQLLHSPLDRQHHL